MSENVAQQMRKNLVDRLYRQRDEAQREVARLRAWQQQVVEGAVSWFRHNPLRAIEAMEILSISTEVKAKLRENEDAAHPLPGEEDEDG